MAGTASQMLPSSRMNPERTRFQNHGAQTNDAFADAMVANFPQDPSLLQRRNGYAQILVGQGLPIEQAMAEAEQAIPDAVPVTPGPGSQLPPISNPADLGALGRDGDTMVAHINPDEAALLKRHGGSGTINPRTGLPEFRVGGSMGAGDPGQGAGHGGPSGAGGSRTAGGGGGNGGGPQATGAGNAAIADKMIMDKYIADPREKIPDERSYWDAVGNLGSRYTDYKDYGNSTLENLGNFALGWGTGISEIDPTKQALGASKGRKTASWGVDPVGTALGLAGSFVGAPLGLLYGIGKKAIGAQGPMLSFDGFNGSPGMNGGNTSPSSAGAGDAAPGSPSIGRGDAGGTHLLPSISAANPGAAQPPQAIAPPGSLLPPITAPAGGTNPGAYMPISGPSRYGWQRPAWDFR